MFFWWRRPPRPGKMYVVFREEILTMAKVNVRTYDVALPPKSAEDVVERRLTVANAGDGMPTAYPVSFGLGEDGPPSIQIKVVEGQKGVALELRDVDNAGNVSDPSLFSFDATDTTAPVAPGELGVSFVSESIEEVPPVSTP